MKAYFSRLFASKKDRHKIIAFLLLIGVIVLAGYLRFNAFWLSHWRGDQSHYITLAMKLDLRGFKDYNLSGARMEFLHLSKDPPIRMVWVDDKNYGKEGDLLYALRTVGQSYYDEPFHYRAPLFPLTLMMAHRLLAYPNQPYVVCSTNLGRKVRDISPRAILEGQFWAAVVPYAFNLMVIWMTAILAWKLFPSRRRIGLYASVIMCLNPLSIWLAHKILTEDVTLFWVMASAVALMGAYRRNTWYGYALSGVCSALAILSNQRSLLMIAITGLFLTLAFYRKNKKKKSFEIKTLVKAAVNRPFVYYIVPVLLLTFPWFYTIWSIYGSPIHTPDSGSLSAHTTDLTGWFSAIRRRPHTTVLFSFGLVMIAPLFGLMLLSFRRFYRAVRGGLLTPETLYIVFLWIWVLVWFLYLSDPVGLWNVGNKEHRYFYAAHPAIAILSAYVLDGVRKKLAKTKLTLVLAEGIIVILFVLHAWRALPIAYEKVFAMSLLF